MSYDFYNRLMNGESADEIAKAITDELNKAMKQVDAEKQAKEAEIQKTTEKKADAQAVCDAMSAFMKKWYGVDAEVEPAEMIKVFEMANKLSKTMDELADKVDKKADKAKDSVDDVIDKFLDLMGW